ncbi:acid protease [Crucibulum laeve]|uniref:Acid protease n=1 Tax=Crucibulum laeve TaxID=68775 RepID=A0A5C3M4U9_9AGAR|nr:acid protease [Crucibulum laeve]
MWFTPAPLLVAFIAAFVLEAEASGLSSRLVPRSNPITIPLHSQFARAVGDNGTNITSGLTPVTMSSDRQSYFAVISTGKINFRVALDTASSDLWVISSACETDACKAVPRYPLTYQSPSFVAVGDNSTKFRAEYADGTSASGFIARETVKLSNLAVANQAFGIVTESNVSMVDETSGILGLGFPRLSSFPQTVSNSTPFFANLAQQGLLEYPLFAVSLTRNATGSLSIGAIDASIVTNASRISWNRVAQFPPFGAENNASSYLQWVIPLSAFAVNGTQFLPSPTYPTVASNHSLALFDVGASGIYGPYQDVVRIYGRIDGARLVDSSGQWAVPCDTAVTMAFTFGNTNYTLQPSDYLIGPASGNPNLCLSWPRALPPSSDAVDWQIGGAFLRTVYSIFSFGINGKEPPLIGLYPLHNTTTLTETADQIASVLSSISATVATTLPNFLLPTPSFTTPSYALNTSISASIGGIVSTGLATSTYSALLGQGTTFNASAVPTITPIPSVVTLVLTDSAGDVTTSVSTNSMAAVTLGIPPGWNAGTALSASSFLPGSILVMSWLILL